MTDAERIARLRTALEGDRAIVNDAFGIWSLNSDLSGKRYLSEPCRFTLIRTGCFAAQALRLPDRLTGDGFAMLCSPA